MSKQFEELSKNLASGMSRRRAFGRFATGIGAVLGGLAVRKPARAGDGIGEFCVDLCRDIFHLRGEEFGDCVSECVKLISTNVNRH
ncbi:exported hypothetical protein [Candidatus Sulfopaludibacter sp. SbA4]|nr:exported hypothetical protein [Candidatus Sulfopaludibacter sp. SbA4]